MFNEISRPFLMGRKPCKIILDFGTWPKPTKDETASIDSLILLRSGNGGDNGTSQPIPTTAEEIDQDTELAQDVEVLLRERPYFSSRLLTMMLPARERFFGRRRSYFSSHSVTMLLPARGRFLDGESALLWARTCPSSLALPEVE